MSTKTFAWLAFFGMTSFFASLNPAAAQGSAQLATPKPQPSPIVCSKWYGSCGCKGSEDCGILKKFASAGGCSKLRCADDICVCDLAAMTGKDSLVLTDARRKNLIKPNGPDQLKAPDPKPVKDCSATAKCGNTTYSCSVKGSGVCQGTDGKGVWCQTIKANGDTEGEPVFCN